MESVVTELTPIARLRRDVKEAGKNLSKDEARYLVDTYYQMQRNRIRAAHQVRQLAESGEPNSAISYFEEMDGALENQIKSVLDAYSKAHPIGEWMRSIVGIGPVIAAGFLAHIDITKAPTVGHIWRFAGLDPTCKWEKGKKRPWNAELKRLCWILGECFTKVSGHEDAIYGHVYIERKKLEIERNEAGMFADQAAASLDAKKYGKDTDAYKCYIAGKLPPARIHLRAQRYSVKLFLSALHEVWRKHEGLPVPLPYPIAFMGHAHKIDPPKVS